MENAKKIRTYEDYIEILRNINKEYKGTVPENVIDKIIHDYMLDERFGITILDIKTDLSRIRTSISSYEEYLDYLQTLFIMAAGNMNDELLDDFINEFQLNSRFEITLEDVKSDIEKISNSIKTYEQYMKVLYNLFYYCKENVSNDDINNFIKAYKLDERFGISDNDVMHDLLILITKSEIKKKVNNEKKHNMFSEIKKALNILCNDSKIEGRKNGYVIASKEFEPLFILYKTVYSKIRDVVKDDKIQYENMAIVLNEQLKCLEKHKEILDKDYDEKLVMISKTYNISVDYLTEEIYTENKHNKIFNNIIETLTMQLIAGGMKMANYYKYTKIGYMEAKELYNKKINVLKKDFVELSNKAEKDINRLIELIIDIQDVIWQKRDKISQMEILREGQL